MTPIYFIPINLGVMLWECSSCGALISQATNSSEKHRQWHKDNDRTPIDIQT